MDLRDLIDAWAIVCAWEQMSLEERAEFNALPVDEKIEIALERLENG